MADTTSPTTTPPYPPTTTPPAQPGTQFFSGGGTTTGAPTTATPGNPLISQDQSSLSQYFIGQIGGYPVDLGGSLGGQQQSTTVGAALQDLYSLTTAQLVTIQTQLLDAGFYRNPDGTPMTSAGAISLGHMDSQTWIAMGLALGQAATSGQSLSGILQGNVQAGTGAAQQNTLPGAVTGGANTYQINLTDPKAVNYLAAQVAQATLGRNPTADEISKITSMVNSGALAQGYAQESAGEQSSQARYQAGVNQRNIAYQFEKNPKAALGPVPSGPFKSNSDWAAAMLSYAALPVTPQNVAFITQFANQMGGNANNPLAAQNPTAASTPGPGGVAVYQNPAQGIQATVSELYNPKYAGIVAALQNGDPSAVDQTALNNGVTVWSNGKIKSITPAAPDAAATTSAAAYQTSTAGPANPSSAAAIPGLQNVGSGLVVPPPAAATAPADTGQGQQPPNPGDQYISPTTAITTNPVTPEAAAYNYYTTGQNAVPYLGNQYLQALQTVGSLIRGEV